jgi:crotonobetainyl-CoA:carnitine CoA-transferase CaiB-like acyl-CoA transferase
MGGPLEGMRVVDLSTMVSGPMCTQILADQGADVIKVESPGGDLVRWLGSSKGGMSAWYASTNRGKRAITVDIGRPEGREVVVKLAERADVVVQNFRPGVADRQGVGYEALRAVNPDLVYVSISGFGPTGPYARRRAYDSIVQSLGGVAGAQADPATGTPSLVRSILADKVTAQTAAQAITAAYVARLKGKGGQHLEIAMIDALLAWGWGDLMQHVTLLDDDATKLPSMLAAYRLISVKDGHVCIGAGTDDQFAGLWRALERPDLAADPRFATATARSKHWGECVSTYEAACADWLLADLLPRLEAEDVPHAPVLIGEQVAHDPQVVHNRTLRVVRHPVAGAMRTPIHPVRFSGTPALEPEALLPAPSAGEHTDGVLVELGYDAAAIEALREEGAVR